MLQGTGGLSPLPRNSYSLFGEDRQCTLCQYSAWESGVRALRKSTLGQGVGSEDRVCAARRPPLGWGPRNGGHREEFKSSSECHGELLFCHQVLSIPISGLCPTGLLPDMPSPSVPICLSPAWIPGPSAGLTIIRSLPCFLQSAIISPSKILGWYSGLGA